MSSENDMKLFYSEAEDLIQKIEDLILELEEHPKNPKPIQDLFFAYHTLKGLTGMVGLDNLSTFCHRFETFMEKNKDTKGLKRQGDFIQLLFESLDIIKKTINNAKTGDLKDLEEPVLEEITGFFNNFDVEEVERSGFFNVITPNEIEVLKSDKKNKFYKIYIRIQEVCVFKKVRAFIILRALKQEGRLCSSAPNPDLLENGKFNTEFELYYISQKDTNHLTSILNEVLEIENKVISTLTPEVFFKKISEYSPKPGYSTEVEPFNLDYDEGDYDFEDSEGNNIENVTTIVDDFTNITGEISSVKVDLETIENLMNNFGEVIILKNQLNQILKEKQNWEINRLFDNMDKLFLEIQEIIFKLKLVRVESTFRRYKRLVRDVAKETGKSVQLILEGTSVEIDRKILEELNSPLVHLLRNAIYHGIEYPNERQGKGKSETGIIKLQTYRRAGSIYIEISDDGKGLDYERIRNKAIELGKVSAEDAMDLNENDLNKFMFMPGFSILAGADMISGRGMGLAIVADKIKELGGSLEVFSEKNDGSIFTLNVPFTRAILKAQLLKVSGDLFAIPIENIEQILFFNRELIEYIGGEEYYRLGKKLIPLIRLHDFLNIHNDDILVSNGNSKVAVWCKKDDNNSALFVVDEILQQMEVVIKPFRSKFSSFQEILGVTVTGDGSICLVIDVLNIISSLMKELKGLQLMDIAH